VSLFFLSPQEGRQTLADIASAPPSPPPPPRTPGWFEDRQPHGGVMDPLGLSAGINSLFEGLPQHFLSMMGRAKEGANLVAARAGEAAAQTANSGDIFSFFGGDQTGYGALASRLSGHAAPSAQDWIEEARARAESGHRDYVANQIDPTTRSAAANLIAPMAGFIGSVAVTSAAGTPALSFVSQGAGAEEEAYRANIADGMAPHAARQAARIVGAQEALMTVLPASIEGRLAIRLASGAAIGAGIGIAGRDSLKAYLQAAGYPELADRYQWIDPQQDTISAILGSAFGGVLGHRAHVPQELVAAALVHQDTINRATAFGIPENDASARWQSETLSRMEEQAANDQPIDPGPTPEDVGFVERPQAFHGLTPEEHLQEARQLGNDGEYSDALAHAYLAHLGGAEGAGDVVRMLRQDASPEEQANIMARVAELRREANPLASAVHEEMVAQGLDAHEIAARMAELERQMGERGLPPEMLASVNARTVREESFRDSRLTDFQNKLVEMRRNGMSNSDIAEEMDTTNNSVAATLSQIKRRAPDIRFDKGYQLSRPPTAMEAVVRLSQRQSDGSLLTGEQIAQRLRAMGFERASAKSVASLRVLARNRGHIIPERKRGQPVRERPVNPALANEQGGAKAGTDGLYSVNQDRAPVFTSAIERTAEGGFSTPEDLKAAAQEFLGADWNALADAGRVQVVQSSKDVPAGMLGLPRGIAAVHMRDTRTTYFIANNIRPEQMKGLILHEIGVHHGMEQMLGKGGMRELLRQIEAMLGADHPDIVTARALAERFAGKPEDVPEETLAYLIENHADLPIGSSLLSRVRQWLIKTFGSTFGMRLTIEDIRALALTSLRQVAEQARRAGAEATPVDFALSPAFSKGGNDTSARFTPTGEYTEYGGGRSYSIPLEDGHAAHLSVANNGTVRWGMNPSETAAGDLPTSQRASLGLRAMRGVLDALEHDASTSGTHIYRFTGNTGRAPLYRYLGQNAGRHGFELRDLGRGEFELRRASGQSSNVGSDVAHGLDDPTVSNSERVGNSAGHAFDANDWGRRLAFPRSEDVPNGAPVVSPTEFRQASDVVTGANYGEEARKVVSIGGQPVAVAELSRGPGGITIQRIDTVEGARRQGLATRLIDDLFREFPDTPIRTTMQTRAGSKLFAQYERRADGSYASNTPFYDYFNNRTSISLGVPEVPRGMRGAGSERGTARFQDERLNAQENKAVEMARNNYASDEIADELSVSKNTVLRYLRNARAMGIEVDRGVINGRPSAVSNESLLHARDQLIAAGHPPRGVPNILAERFGLTPNNVRQRLWQASKSGNSTDGDVKFSVGQNHADPVESRGFQDKLRAVEERLTNDGILRRGALGNEVSARAGSLGEPRLNRPGEGESPSQSRERGRGDNSRNLEPAKIPRAVVRDILSVSGLRLEKESIGAMGRYRASIDTPHELAPSIARAISADEANDPTQVRFDLVEGENPKLLIRLSMNHPSVRNTGAGKWLYRQLIDWGLDHGYEVSSDFSVSPQAQRVYESFRRMGYEVERNPAATEKHNGTLSTRDLSPVYRVRHGDTAEIFDAAPPPPGGYEINGPTLADRMQPLIEARQREEAYAKLSPAQQALTDTPNMKFSVGRRDINARDLLARTEEQKAQAAEMRKGFEAAAKCAARHGASQVLRSLPTAASFVTLRATAAATLPSADAMIGQVLGLGAAIPLGITVMPEFARQTRLASNPGAMLNQQRDAAIASDARAASVAMNEARAIAPRAFPELDQPMTEPGHGPGADVSQLATTSPRASANQPEAPLAPAHGLEPPDASFQLTPEAQATATTRPPAEAHYTVAPLPNGSALRTSDITFDQVPQPSASQRAPLPNSPNNGEDTAQLLRQFLESGKRRQ